MNPKQYEKSVYIWNKIFLVLKEISFKLDQIQSTRLTYYMKGFHISRYRNELNQIISLSNFCEPSIDYDFNHHMRKLKDIERSAKSLSKLIRYEPIVISIHKLPSIPTINMSILL